MEPIKLHIDYASLETVVDVLVTLKEIHGDGHFRLCSHLEGVGEYSMTRAELLFYPKEQV